MASISSVLASGICLARSRGSRRVLGGRMGGRRTGGFLAGLAAFGLGFLLLLVGLDLLGFLLGLFLGLLVLGVEFLAHLLALLGVGLELGLGALRDLVLGEVALVVQGLAAFALASHGHLLLDPIQERGCHPPGVPLGVIHQLLPGQDVGLAGIFTRGMVHHAMLVAGLVP